LLEPWERCGVIDIERPLAQLSSTCVHRNIDAIFANIYPTLIVGVACTRFRRHRVRCFDGTGGESWRGGSLHESSSLRLCG
jgi:hypothetical protein